MEKQITGKEIRKDMEYLVKLLHKEWERSGKTKAQVMVSLSDAVEIEKRMAGVIQDKQKQLENEELTFQQSMELSKQTSTTFSFIGGVSNNDSKFFPKFFIALSSPNSVKSLLISLSIDG